MKFRVSVPVQMKILYEVDVEAGSVEHAQILGLHEARKFKMPKEAIASSCVFPKHDDCGARELRETLPPPAPQRCRGGCSRGGDGPGCGQSGCMG